MMTQCDNSVAVSVLLTPPRPPPGHTMGFSPCGGVADLCKYFMLSGPCCLCHGCLALLLLCHESS